MNFQDYMKKFTTIDPKFIDDFFSLYDQETSDNDFVIDLDIVIKWLGMEKFNFKKTLKSSYIKDVDYEIIKVKSNGRGGQNRETILLTPSCFKKICQLTKTKKGDEIRDYFLEVEDSLKRYYLYIIDGMKTKIQKLEHNQKPKIYPKRAVIYVFQTPDKTDVYKIGKTTSLKNRLRSHQTPLADDINILFYFEVDDVDTVESCVKVLLKRFNYRNNRELLEVDPQIIKDTIKTCGKTVKKIIKMNSVNKNKKQKYYIYFDKDVRV